MCVNVINKCASEYVIRIFLLEAFNSFFCPLTWERVKLHPWIKAGVSSRDSSRSVGTAENAWGVIEGSRIPSDCCLTKFIKTWEGKKKKNTI